MKHSAKIIALFLLAVPLGTISHELGHAFAGIAVGYTPILHYSSVTYLDPLDQKPLIAPSQGILDNSDESPVKPQLWFLIGGPASTVLLGSTGLLLLLAYRNKRQFSSNAYLFSLVLTLFWSREVLIGTSVGIRYLSTGLYGISDEVRIAELMELPPYLVLGILALISLGVCVWILTIIPKHMRIRFVLSSATGIILGWLLWFELAGPRVLP